MKRFRWIHVCLFLLFATLIHGCLALITTITCPNDVTVEEDFIVAIDGSVIGKNETGLAGIAIQIPESFQFRGASYVCSYGERPLKRESSIAKTFRADSGYVIIGLTDSVPFKPYASDDFRVFVKLKASETGNFLLKCISCTGNRYESNSSDEGEDAAPQYFWRSSDPQKITGFASVEGMRYTAYVTVIDPERNGTAALSFSGAREYVALPDTGLFSFSLVSDFTFEAWINTTSLETVLLSTRSDDFLSAFPLEISINEYGAAALLASDGAQIYKTKNMVFIADGKWHHLAVTYWSDSTRYALFLDGKLLEELPLSNGVRNTSHAPPIFGGQAAKRKFFKGVCEELRFWDNVRDVSAISYYKNMALTGYEQHLYALYTFDKASSSKIPNLTRREGLDVVPYNRPKLLPSTAPLRVELLSFNVTQQGREVSMTWETFDESKTEEYQIEKRTESGKYEILKRVDPMHSPTSHQIYTFNDTWSEKKICYYRLRKINTDGSMLFSDEVPLGAELVLNFSLGDNIPNPFSGKTEIPYTLNEQTYVSLTVYDIMGREVQELVSQKQQSGEYKATFDATDYQAGMYFYKLRTTTGSQTKKMYFSK